MFGYAPQRQRLPAIACADLVAASARAVASTSAAAETIWPGVQKPHWSASARDERLDERVVAQALDRRHLAVADRVHERDAREHRYAVELDRAGAAVALAAGDLRAGQAELVAQGVGERRPDRGVDLVAAAVDAQLRQPTVTARMSARWTSRNVVRADDAAARPRPRARAATRQSSRAASSSSRICSRSSTWPSRSSQAFSASPSTPIVSGCRVQRSGVAIERYWWMRANAIGCEKRTAAARRRGLERRPRRRRSGSRCRASMSAQLRPRRSPASAPSAARSGASAAAARRGSRTRRRPAPAATSRKRSSRSIGLQTEVSKKTPALPGEVAGEPGEVGDARVGDDQLRLGVAVDEPREVVGDRRQAAAAVDQDRHAPLGRELEHRARAARRSAGTSARAGGA